MLMKERTENNQVKEVVESTSTGWRVKRDKAGIPPDCHVPSLLSNSIWVLSAKK